MIQRMLAIWSLVPLPFLNQLEHLEVHDSLPITDLTFVLRNSDESCHSDPSQFLCPVQESALVSSLFKSLYSSLVPSAIPTWGTLEVEQAKQKPIPPAIFVRCDHAQLFHGSAPKGRKWIRTPYTYESGMLMNDVFLIKETSKRFFGPLLHVRAHQKDTGYEWGKRPSPKYAGKLTNLGLPGLQNCVKKNFCCL